MLSIIATLAFLAAAIFFGQRWITERAQNSRLRAEIAWLRRRLKNRDG
jgi:hypothetical protein